MADSMTFQIKNMEEFKKKISGLKTAARGSTLKDAVEAGIRVIEGNAVVNINEQFSGRSTGNMAANRSVEVKDEDGKVTGTLTFHSNHARLHEYGGVVKPVKGKFLAIPKTESARKVESPRNYPEDLHFVGSDAGGVLMNSANEVIYLLVTSATMPARPFLRPAMDEHASEIEEAMAEAIKQGIEEAANGNS